MQPVKSSTARQILRCARPWVAALLLAAVGVSGAATSEARAACPWIVQPFAQTVQMASEAPAFDIVFDGLDQDARIFYGFTAASLDLVWQLSTGQELPELGADARRLEPKTTPLGTTAYQLSPDTIQPHTIYLVAASTPVEALERLAARIEPARPLALSQLLPRMRGGSDWSGPLPHRSLPGYEIGAGDAPADGEAQAEPELAGAGVQICAYQVAMR
jgi:hypothetical protein